MLEKKGALENKEVLEKKGQGRKGREKKGTTPRRATVGKNGRCKKSRVHNNHAMLQEQQNDFPQFPRNLLCATTNSIDGSKSTEQYSFIWCQHEWRS